ncbi:hypothetical protein [Frigidibacter oleivorans]|uniref:hypothetical protein n=1 Tax=Frigidibacter oleivorans TaxID=2487129 RepID=UPI000F8F2404|nr:hypothetical protein [Frigidibacter oleivorans]
MKLASATLALLLLSAVSASAECYADYKAKRDEGRLRLHYGVARLPDRACGSAGDAAAALAPRLAAEGWTLLNVVSVFGPEGLDQRKGSAGDFFLRY